MEEREIVGTSLNTVKAKVPVTKPKMESFSQVKEVDLNAESPPVAESEGSNNQASNNQASNNEQSNNEGSGISVNNAQSENSKLKFNKPSIRLKSATKS
jgi:hypothetical protein